MELIPCDPAQPDKSQVVTAARIKEFMMKLGVWDMKDKGVVKIIADHAIAGGLGQYLRAVGWQNTENSIYVCKSHSEQIFLKRLDSEFNEIVENNDLDGKSKIYPIRISDIFFRILSQDIRS